MEQREKIIQYIKNILIAVLFTSAVLLLSFFWNDVSLNKLGNFTLGLQYEESYAPELSELTRPGQIEVSFGSGIYTVVSADWNLTSHGIALPLYGSSPELSGRVDEKTTSDINIYEYLRFTMGQYLMQSDIKQEKIEKAQYDEVMSYPSVTAAFSFEIPFVDFLSNNGMNAPQGSENISYVTEISFSAASSENLFIYDASEGMYYRFVTRDADFAGKMSEELSSLIEGIENSEITPYYTIESLAGIKNDTLIPLSQQGIPEYIRCKSEFSINDESEVRRYEQMFFSSGLDFVRKITENKGSLIYTYGYNQKVLRLDETGRISYTEEFDPVYYSEIGFYEGLEQAVEYVKNHGGWSQMTGEKLVPYLSNVVRVKSDDGKYIGYRYEFSVKIKGIPVLFSSGAMLSVEMYGKQITSYQRDIILLSQNVTTETSEVINAIDVITEEYNEIGLRAAAAAAEKGDEEKAELYTSGNQFENVTENIDLIRFCMLRDTENDPSVLIPAWYIRLDGIRFWCSHEDGHIILFNSTEEK